MLKELVASYVRSKVLPQAKSKCKAIKVPKSEGRKEQEARRCF